MRRITIEAGGVRVVADLLDNPTAQALWEALPIEQRASTWGDEIYFSVPVQFPAAAGKEDVEVGDIAIWPPGNAFCIFFGPTPASRGSEPRAASAVTVIGKVQGDATVFRAVRSGERVRLSRLEG